jgi:hypothetical protein
MAALIVLRKQSDQALAHRCPAAQTATPGANPTPLDRHYYAIRASMQGVSQELSIAA